MNSSTLSPFGVPIPKSFHETTAPDSSREPDEQRPIVVAEPVALGRRVDRQQPLALAAHRLGQRARLGVVGEERRDVLAVLAALVRGLAAADAGGAGVHRLPRRAAPSPRSRRRSAARSSAASPMTNRRTALCPTCVRTLTPMRPGIHVEVLRKRLPAERGEELQRLLRDLLGRGEQAHEVVLVVGAHRRERVAAVAGQDRRDPVHRRRVRGGVPEQLRVVVGVRVDEARARRPGRRRRSCASPVPLDLADRRDATVLDRDVAARTRACPVPSTMRAVLDDHVIRQRITRRSGSDRVGELADVVERLEPRAQRR